MSNRIKLRSIKMDKNYMQVINSLPNEIKDLLKDFPQILQSNVKEVSIRTQKPITIVTFSGNFFPKTDGGFSKHIPISPYIITNNMLFDCIKVLTEYSLHSYKNNINAGFFTIKGGHRIGVVGSCIYDEINPRKIISIKEISSLNIRIARQIKGVANDLVKEIYSKNIGSTLIVGAPATGKTTLLRDICFCLANTSNQILPYSSKVALIDERGELASVYQGIPQNDVGILTDVYDGYSKFDGMNFAIKTISPDVILIDEISSQSDIESIKYSLHSGVAVIATTHAKNERELFAKNHLKRLILDGAFDYIIYLNSKNSYKITNVKIS